MPSDATSPVPTLTETFFLRTSRPNNWVLRPELGEGRLAWIKLARGFFVLLADFAPKRALRYRWTSRSFVNFSFFDFGDWRERSLDSQLAVSGFDATANLFYAPLGERFETRIAGKRQRCMTVLVRPDYLADWFDVPEDHLPAPLMALVTGQQTSLESFSTPMRPGMLALLARTIDECPLNELQRVFVRGMAASLVALFLDMARPQAEAPALKRRDLERLNSAREQLRARLQAPPSLAALAKTVGLSVPRLQRGFRQTFGTTVNSYVQEERLEAARAALASGMSVAEAARAVGYRSRTTFSKLFRERFGVSPRSYDGLEYISNVVDT